ncbi:hypothetical protein [Kyrpidia spormannii]|uniref:hypothetical protein n=1 Tax=Kyrpidia spormannii TaxID=2055160 RepID=UPI0018D617F2|nr:hypothetical protein [Kyrpidia spormannii]
MASNDFYFLRGVKIQCQTGSILLDDQQISTGQPGEVTGVREAGTGYYTRKMEKLSSIIEVLNQRFGTDFTPADKLFFDQLEEDMLGDAEVVKSARSNTMENFAYAFEDVFMSKVIDRMGQNDKIFVKLMDDPEFRKVVKEWISRLVYEKARG